MAMSRIKMTYIAAQYRVRVQFTKADCMAQPVPPAQLLERAKAKLQRERRGGHIAFYRIFKTRLEKMWAVLRAADEPLDTLVAVTLATGAPLMPGVEVRLADGGNALGYLTISAAADVVEAYGFRPFKLFIGKRLLTQGVTAVPDPAHLHAAWIRAARGESVAHYPILKLAATSTDLGAKGPYELLVNQRLGEVKLVVHDLRAIVDQNLLAQLSQSIIQEVRQLSATSGQTYLLRTKAIERELISANRGPERFGLDLPVMHLAGISKQPLPSNQQPSSTAEAKTPGLALLIKVRVSPDAMTAQIDDYAKALFTSPEARSPQAWSSFFSGMGIVHGVPSHCILDAIKKVESGSSLVGLLIAQGEPPQEAREPFLYETYLHAAENKAGAVDVRERQQRRSVLKGEVIAEVRFKTMPVVGRNIFGKDVAPPVASNLPDIKTGDGVKRSGPYQYIAEYAGIPEIEAGTIQLTKSLVIPGNINLASGNIHFTGQVEINGSIEAGALVEVAGNLVVHGLIQGGTVKVSGTLTVDGGIMTNRAGLVRVGGDLKALFIENSQVYCKGQITVTKSVMSSHVYGERGLVVEEPEGLIAGGEVSCFDHLSCANLGRTGGVTKVHVGVSPHVQFAVAIRQKRLAQLEQCSSDEQAQLKSLATRRADQMTAHHHELKESLLERLQRCAKIIIRVRDSIAAVKKGAQINAKATISVAHNLCMSTRVEIGGHHVPLASDVFGVAIHSTQLNGSYLRSFDQPTGAGSPPDGTLKRSA